MSSPMSADQAVAALKAHGVADSELKELKALNLPNINWQAVLEFVQQYGPVILPWILRMFSGSPTTTVAPGPTPAQHG